MAKEEKLVPVKILYDWWSDKEERVAAGSVVEMPLDAAKKLLSECKAERADPLPGEA